MKKNLIVTLAFLIGLTAAGLHAESENGVYFMGGLDAKLLTNDDANDYFNLDNQQLSTQGYADGVFHLGIQFRRWMALEASANFGPFRNNAITYDSATGARELATNWNLTTYSITPGITWVGWGYVSMLGLRIGQANLAGHVDDNDDGVDGSYDQKAQTYDIGVLYRSSTILMDHLSIGLEFGYDWTRFNNIQDSNGTGSYSSVQSPEHDVSPIGHNGAQTVLDFSGPHIALVVGLWSNAPVSLHRHFHDDAESGDVAP